MGQFNFKLVYLNIGLSRRSITEIRGRFCNTIAGGITVQN